MIHIQLMCSHFGPRLSLRWITQHPEWAAVLMQTFGCQDCITQLAESVRTMKVIRD